MKNDSKRIRDTIALLNQRNNWRLQDSEPIPATRLQAQLVMAGACWRAHQWVGTKTARQAWKQCHRADWMRWAMAELISSTSRYLQVCSELERSFGLSCTPENIREAVPFERLQQLVRPARRRRKQ